ncbi:hypothetical protein DYB28_001180 [Aphanomyces astaci]|uniref:Uncharacterized protein n=1 Tax=Aphanomyces astaci TaxID=112090 RepID=A0A397DTI7_APHAT|nr:hypothetical protein DYB25_002549 [Aphanomyces astaci]RHY57041.1 hypothetical protein DYB38_008213 [Aphanomyces astaci]RHY67949.1 hypothetical protein DYB30_003459 [Aphanomyces astaci]RHZ33515.1 hypothetical protein DYB31_003583 [Aphanomyces astaci]RLO06657.1 hypothetical protein DYB28_001180 [Aphanomyces astaci]
MVAAVVAAAEEMAVDEVVEVDVGVKAVARVVAEVAFVGSMAAGSSVSSGGGVAKAKKQPQSTEVGISLLEDGIDNVHVADVEVPIQINIHKSGKAVLVLGDKTFDLAPGQPPSFYEEVVSIDVKDKLLSMLGPVATHLVITPDFDSLLQ